MLDVVALIYSLPFFLRNMPMIMRGKINVRGAFLRGVKVYFSKNSGTLLIGRRARLKHCKIWIFPDCQVVIGGGKTVVKSSEFCTQDNNSIIKIGEDFTMEGGHIAATEGHSIRIGRDCMFSGDIEIRNGDSHTMIDEVSKRRINHAKDVVIGNHVWLCAHSRVLKGSVVPDYSIVGNSTIVTGTFETTNTIIAGNPARIVRKDINWDRQR